MWLRGSDMDKFKGSFPVGCKIIDIKRGKGSRNKFIYAKLIGPDGFLLISATLEYIYERLSESDIKISQ